MKIEAKLDLGEMLCGDDWDTTVGEMVKDALRAEINSEIKRAVKDDPNIKKAIGAMKKLAAEQIIASLSRRDEA